MCEDDGGYRAAGKEGFETGTYFFKRKLLSSSVCEVRRLTVQRTYVSINRSSEMFDLLVFPGYANEYFP